MNFKHNQLLLKVYCRFSDQNLQKSSLCQRITKRQMSGQSTYRQKGRTANTGLAKVAVQCSADTFVVNQSLVLRINICGENRHLRQARKR